MSSRYVVIGGGRLGRATVAGLQAAGAEVEGPVTRAGRIAAPAADAESSVVLLCVPERELGAAARRADIPRGAIVGHCSASAPLDLLAPHERFSAHPLMTFAGDDDPSRFIGAGCAIDGSSPRALDVARALATRLGMRPVAVPTERRALYHAGASIASNFLVTLASAAERLATLTGVDRAMLAPLVRASIENWAARGFAGAITGPIARGDEATVAAQRAAITDAAPDLLPLWDMLAGATRTALAAPTHGLRRARTVSELRAVVDDARRAGARIGFVPTMGALHDGHLSLVRRAREACGCVVVSLFVNPTQFNDPRDLEAYPRTEERDRELVAGAGADVLFVPSVETMYPDGSATTVEVAGVTEPLEGEARGTAHFRGVTTVVAKLFNMVRPDVAFFGQKDAQQALVIRRMTRDLDFPLDIEVCPTVREPDGLAMSSRNVRLSADARRQATALHQCLEAMRTAIATGERDVARLLDAGHRVLASRGIVPADVEYLAVVDSASLAPLERLVDGREALIAIAARVGGVRLIDNALATP